MNFLLISSILYINIVIGSLSISFVGCTQDKRPYIIGGQDALEDEFPWMASLQQYNLKKNKWHHYCGGSLINGNWILTARHCVDQFEAVEIFRQKSGKSESEKVINSFRVLVGGTTLKSYKQQFKIEKIIIPGCNLYELVIFGSDIALMKVRPFGYGNQTIRPIKTVKLPEPRSDPSSDTLTLCGFGSFINENISSSFHLQKQDFKIMDSKRCEYYYFFLTLGMGHPKDLLCIIRDQSTGCYGDSGGPLVQFTDRSKGQAIQYGIASFIQKKWLFIKTDERCKPGGFTAFTKVSKFTDWIQRQIDTFNDQSNDGLVLVDC